MVTQARGTEASASVFGRVRVVIAAVVMLVGSVFLAPSALAVGPAAPTLLGPANGAATLVPLTLSWSAAADSIPVVAYNWEVSTSSSFASPAQLGSTNGATSATVSGLVNGSYFWRVQGYDGSAFAGVWSATRPSRSPDSALRNPERQYSVRLLVVGNFIRSRRFTCPGAPSPEQRVMSSRPIRIRHFRS